MRKLAALATFCLLLAACGNSDSTDQAAVQENAAVDTAPALTPGAQSVGQVTIDDTPIDYVTVTPDGFEVGDTAPVLLAMPPGGQDLSLTESVTAGVYATEALARGWVVVSPAAPESGLYFEGSEELIPGFLDWMETWVSPEGDRPHLAGISNGGISSFRLVAEQPDAFASVLVFPGFARGDDDKAALADLADIPVRLFVGEQDTNWVSSGQTTFDVLDEAGADVVLEIVPGEGHSIGTLRDGVRVFDELDAAR